jgi:hypothetical protein
MAAKIPTAYLPQKEFRRKYMKHLVHEISQVCKVDEVEARKLSDALVFFLSQRVHGGKAIDLGFASISPKKKKATIVKSHLKTTNNGTFYMGDQIRWSVSISKSWQSASKPHWSKYS